MSELYRRLAFYAGEKANFVADHLVNVDGGVGDMASGHRLLLDAKAPGTGRFLSDCS